MKSWDDMKRMKQDDRMRRYPLESTAGYLFNNASCYCSFNDKCNHSSNEKQNNFYLKSSGSDRMNRAG